MPIFEHCMQNRNHICFGGEMAHSKQALQLLKADNNRCASHETSDCGMRQEIHQNPQSARIDQIKNKELYNALSALSVLNSP